jgi:hypothetical protein
MKKLLVVLALGLSFASTSQAFIRLEPYVGYEMGNGTDQGTTLETKGINAGARVGWLSTNEKLWAVLDYQTAFDGSIDYGDGTSRVQFKKTIIAGVVGYNFLENPLRVWAGYGVDEWALKDSGSTTFKGKVMKFGLGYTKYKPVSINFEYFSENFDEVSTSTGSIDADMKGTSYMLSVSWPLKY